MVNSLLLFGLFSTKSTEERGISDLEVENGGAIVYAVDPTQCFFFLRSRSLFSSLMVLRARDLSQMRKIYNVNFTYSKCKTPSQI